MSVAFAAVQVSSWHHRTRSLISVIFAMTQYEESSPTLPYGAWRWGMPPKGHNQPSNFGVFIFRQTHVLFFFFSGDDIHSSEALGFTRVPGFSIYTIGMSHFTWLAWWTKIDKHWTCCKRDPNLETWTTKNRVELPSLALFCELNKTDIAWYSDDFTWHPFHGLWKRISNEGMEFLPISCRFPNSSDDTSEYFPPLEPSLAKFLYNMCCGQKSINSLPQTSYIYIYIIYCMSRPFQILFQWQIHWFLDFAKPSIAWRIPRSSWSKHQRLVSVGSSTSKNGLGR